MIFRTLPSSRRRSDLAAVDPANNARASRIHVRTSPACTRKSNIQSRSPSFHSLMCKSTFGSWSNRRSVSSASHAQVMYPQTSPEASRKKWICSCRIAGSIHNVTHAIGYWQYSSDFAIAATAQPSVACKSTAIGSRHRPRRHSTNHTFWTESHHRSRLQRRPFIYLNQSIRDITGLTSFSHRT